MRIKGKFFSRIVYVLGCATLFGSVGCTPILYSKLFDSQTPCESQAASQNFAGGSGTISDPYLVCNAEQLDLVRNYLSSHFKQTRDIDLSASENGKSENWFLPIAGTVDKSDVFAGSVLSDLTQVFTGVYDGNDYKIENWSYVPQAEDDKVAVGFFVANAGTIKNLELSSFSLTGYAFVGGLVALNAGSIDHVTVSGSLADVSYAGSLMINIGYGPMAMLPFIGALGVGVESGSISHLTVSGNVNMPNTDIVAGAIGWLRDASQHINDSEIHVSDATISGHGAVAGIASFGLLSNSADLTTISIHDSSIRNSTLTAVGPTQVIVPPNAGGGFASVGGTYSDITVSNVTVSSANSEQAGAFSAKIEDGLLNNIVVTGSTVTGGDDVGGLIGKFDAGRIDQSYGTNNTVNGESNVGGLVGSGREITVNDSYVTNTSVVGTGDEIGGFIGRDEGDDGAALSNSYVSNTTVSGDDEVSGFVGTAGGANTAAQIANCYVDTVTLNTTGNYIGGLIGSESGSTGAVIDSSYASNLTINATGSYIGGLIGQVTATIDDSYADQITLNTGSSSNQVGGLIGSGDAAVTNSHATGIHIANGHDHLGGLAGETKSGGTLTNVYAIDVTITGHDSLGGLVGNAEEGVTTGYSTDISLTGNQAIGGFVGNHIDGTIHQSHASNVTIHSVNDAGGFVGYMHGVSPYHPVITNSYSQGFNITTVEDSSTKWLAVAGFIGSIGNDATSGGIVQRSFAKDGTITLSNGPSGIVATVAGFVGGAGNAATSLIENCYAANITITGNDLGTMGSHGSLYMSGFMGWTGSTIRNTYTIGVTLNSGSGNTLACDYVCSTDMAGTYSNNYATGSAGYPSVHSSKITADYLLATGNLPGITDDASGAQTVWKWGSGAYLYPIFTWE